MDLHLVSNQPPAPPTLLDSLERLLNTKRRQYLQNHLSNPPHALGYFIFAVVVLEMVLARRLAHGLSLHPGLFPQFIGTALVFLVLEWAFVSVAHTVSHVFNKKGRTWTVLTFFHLGLTPLLLFLPISLLCSFFMGGEGIRQVAFLILLFKSLAHWREAVDVAFKFTRIQSAIVLYATTGLAFSLALIVFYGVLVNKLFETMLGAS